MAGAVAPAQLTREQLHQLVWSEPMRTLAPRYGLSDAGLAKICRRHKVPRPWRGYWQQKAAGKRVRPARLQPLKPEQEKHLGTVILRPSEGRNLRTEETGPIADQKKYEAEHPIVVPERMGRAHPLVRMTREFLRDAARGRWTYEQRQRIKRLDVDVDSKSLARALRIWNTLIRALEERSFLVSLELERDRPVTFATVNGVKLQLRMDEQRKRVERPPERRRIRLLDPDPWDKRPQYDYVHSGELRLKIEESSWMCPSVRKTWKERGGRTLEGQLNDFVVGLVRAAEVKRVRLQEQAEERQRREAEQQHRMEEERRQRELELRAKRLERLATAWAKAENVRSFVAAAREAAARAEMLEPGSELTEWLDWAEVYAEELDPLRQKVAELPRAGAAPEDQQALNPYRALW